MLVVTRRPGEAISIGDDVRVVVLSVEGDRVRLGIEAPRAVEIRRTDASEGPTEG
jgi:carbon storage regulator